MPTVSSRVVAIALVLLVLCPPVHAARAFGLRLGPIHFELPTPGLNRHRRIARPEPDNAPQAQIDRPTLLYPALVWPSLADAIFWPRPNEPWPFGYHSIVDQAFAKYSGEQAAELCSYRDTTPEIIARVQRDTEPSADQKPFLEKLAAALGQANGYLIKSCPREIPLRPVARLQLMEAQIDATIMALEIARPPLQKFEGALDEKQRARWNAAAPASGEDSVFCTSKTANHKSGTTNSPLPELEQAVRPTDKQRKSLADVDEAFKRAASGLADECAGAVPQTASRRLVITEGWLDTTWRAVQTIEAALANFQKDLSDEQNARINALEIASAR